MMDTANSALSSGTLPVNITHSPIRRNWQQLTIRAIAFGILLTSESARKSEFVCFWHLPVSFCLHIALMAMVFGSASSAYAARIDFMTSNP